MSFKICIMSSDKFTCCSALTSGISGIIVTSGSSGIVIGGGGVIVGGVGCGVGCGSNSQILFLLNMWPVDSNFFLPSALIETCLHSPLLILVEVLM